jgi:serine/threonine protein kinase
VPRRLGNYELLKKIGAGGMAEVWMGRGASVGGASKAVAVKLMSGATADEPRYRRMFLEEARLSLLLSHSNIAQVFDVGQEGDDCYLVMEWVDGLNLAQLGHSLRASDTLLPYEITGYIIGEIAAALAYAHTVTHEGDRLCVIHRDVSPQNVLVSVSGEVKLTDFGVARAMRDETTGGHVKGKVRYMAPEQFRGESGAATVDLYALGAVLHELLDGRKFRGDVEFSELIDQGRRGVVPRLERSGVPPELEALRVALLQPRPQNRMTSAEDVRGAITAWPGYRNAAAELGELCRRYVGIDAPRSGLFAHAPTEAQTPSSGVDVWSESSAAVSTVLVATRPVSDDAGTPTVSMTDTAATRTSHARASAPESSASRWPRAAWRIAAAVAVVMAVTFGAAIASRSGSTPGDRLATIEPAAADEDAAEPLVVVATTDAEPAAVVSDHDAAGMHDTTAPGPQLGLDSHASDATDTSPGADRVSEHEARARAQPAGRAGPFRHATGRRSRNRAAPAASSAERSREHGAIAKVPLTLRTSGPRTAKLAIDGEADLFLPPKKYVELEVGRHRIDWAVVTRDGDLRWVERPRFEFVVKPGRPYVLDVTEEELRLSRP